MWARNYTMSLEDREDTPYPQFWRPQCILRIQQECIPVGCVPAARRPYAGVCFRGASAWSGEVSAWSRGVSAWSRGMSVSAWSGGSPWSRGGVCLVPGGGGYGIPACTEADTLPPRGQTDTCKNIILATTSLRPVIMNFGAIIQTVQENALCFAQHSYFLQNISSLPG